MIKLIIPTTPLGTRFPPAIKIPKEMLQIVASPSIPYIVGEAMYGIGYCNYELYTKKREKEHFDNLFELEQVLEKCL